MLSTKQIYKLIRAWEIEAGEGFFDYFESNVNEVNLMFWMEGRGYISRYKLNEFCNRNTKWISLWSTLCGYEDKFSLFPYGECEEECMMKATEILAEYMSYNDVYEKRLNDFLNEYFSYKKEMDKSLASDWLEEEYLKTCQLSVDELNEKYFE